MNETIARGFWKCIDEFRFDDMGSLMHVDAIVRMPATSEVFHGAQQYVEFNKKYPGNWRVEVNEVVSQGDMVATAAKVTNEVEEASSHAALFFRIIDGKIQEITEYWSDDTEPPQWRTEAGLSDRY